MDGIQWKEFEFSKDEMTIQVKWWSKDFVAYYDSQFGKLEYGLHIMYACPKKYSEEMLKADYCSEVCSLFKETCSLLQENPDFLSNFKSEFDKVFEGKNQELKTLQEERRKKRKMFKEGKFSQKDWTSFCKEYNQVTLGITVEKNDFLRAYAHGIAHGNIAIENILMGLLDYK